LSDIAIRVEHLSKQFRIGGTRDKRNFLEALTDGFKAPFRRTGRLLRGQATGAAELDDTIWALRDVSFEIKQGELVGIIGRNGAGKSTVLKILSRITEPTMGFAEIGGRVGSLLEVGTGFHHELTGRENIYLNGAVLGMRRAEINRKFDEIVAFAEVERFVDTPVKYYSSGMYLRLAFAVAAHLEPEILIVDEVLAVGDIRFQKKCLNKMEDVRGEGRTVLFVSHNMEAIMRLCPRAVLLDQGHIVTDGPTQQVTKIYLGTNRCAFSAREWEDGVGAPSGEVARLCAVRVRNDEGVVSQTVDIRRPVKIEMEYDVKKPGYILLPHYMFYNEEGILVFKTIDHDPEWRGQPRPTGHYLSTVQIPGNFLAEGLVIVTPALVTLNPTVLEFLERDAVSFEVVDKLNGDSARGDWAGPMSGLVRPLLNWETRFKPDGSALWNKEPDQATDRAD
jgi:lipopolysaccharide transport system ATP-binding protein